jgi:hypothetical protein
MLNDRSGSASVQHQKASTESKSPRRRLSPVDLDELDDSREYAYRLMAEGERLFSLLVILFAVV